MQIKYDQLPQDAKPIVDCLRIVYKVGESKDACIAELNKDIAETENKLAVVAKQPVSDGSFVDELLIYKNRLQHAKATFDKYFE